MLKPGQILAQRFELIGVVGRGGMATVYLAHDTLRDAQVAVKVLHDHLAHDPSMRRRLRREVQAASLVRHEAALVAYDLHAVGETLALSMPFHGGTTLTEHVRNHGPLDEASVRALGARIAGALADAHRHGVLHRDVTPNNVMLESGGDAVLTDFGLARTVGEATATATSVMGTPGYAAPETYHGQRTDPRSDLYGLGAVLYFAATGRSPYGAGAPATILQAQLAGAPEAPAAVRPDLPDDLAATIELLMHADPERRPPGAAEVARALEARRPVVVPEVPDTWDAADEPIMPETKPEPAPLVPTDLPAGPWNVVVRGRRGCDPKVLADRIGQVFELPPGGLEITAAMRSRSRRFIVTPATDRGTAEKLAEAARVAGYQAKLHDDRPLRPLELLGNILPMLIGVVWLAYPFITSDLFGRDYALFSSIVTTLVLAVSGSALGRTRLDPGMPVALTGDISRHVVQPQAEQESSGGSLFDGLSSFLKSIAHEVRLDVDLQAFARNLAGTGTPSAQPTDTAKPSGTTDPAPSASQPAPSRAEGLRGRALGHLDLLLDALDVGGDGLPEVARGDLRRTAVALRAQAVDLGRSAVGLEAALASTPEPEDVSWIHGRLTRLQTMARTGQPVDEAERTRLQAALDRAEEAASARDELSSRLTSAQAQLLEIGALAARARSELHADALVPMTAGVLRDQLDQQLQAVAATREEMGQRHQAARAAASARAGS